MTGFYTVDFSETNFGDAMSIRDPGMNLLMARDHSGWHAPVEFARPRLGHQFYKDQIDTYICGREQTLQEIVIVNLKSGSWQTVWAKNHKEICYP